MSNASVSLARRRSAQLAAKAVKTEPKVEVTPPHVLKARNNFAYFCSLMGKPAADHMKVWHKQFLTGESNEHLLDIAMLIHAC